jgi:diadenosine tetraphosphate (Ap4A) HIT family hydrolase
VSAPAHPGCVLCEGPGGRVVRTAGRWRIVHVDTEAGFPAYYRLVWNGHVTEFTHLSRAERIECMDVICAMEDALLRELQPAKINLASFGNAVPHLHWHVVGRWDWDPSYPKALWAPASRQAPADRLAAVMQRLSGVEARMLEALSPFA